MEAARRVGLSVLRLVLLAACGAAARGEGQCSEGGMDITHNAVMPTAPPKNAQAGRDFGQSCVEYRRVCFDQGVVISFDPAHSPANATSTPLPRLDISGLEYIWAGWTEGMNGDAYGQRAWAAYAPLEVRPASRLEGAPDTQAPRFSACTLPVVMWTKWVHNYAEFFLRVPPRMWVLQRDGALSNHSRLVLGTPAGERAPPFAPGLLKPFTPHEVVSFSEFSQRPPAGASRERCFERAYLCAFEAAWRPGIAGAGQAIGAYYEQQQPPNPLGFAPGTEVLKVLVETRTGPVRSILNAAQLVEQCNAGDAGWRLEAAAPVKRVQCRAASFGGGTAGDVAALRSADVLVVVHGAAAMNWMTMRPNSSMLELRPHQFGSKGWADAYYSVMGENQGHIVHWYALNVETPLAGLPSSYEAADSAAGAWRPRMLSRYARDRHLVLPFGALQEMVQRISAAGRDVGRYLEQRRAGRHYAVLAEDGAGRLVLHAKGRPQQQVVAVGTAAAAAAEREAAQAVAQKAAQAAAGAFAAAQAQAARSAAATVAGPAEPAAAGPAAAAAGTRAEGLPGAVQLPGLRLGWRSDAGQRWERASQLSLLAALCCLLAYAWRRSAGLRQHAVQPTALSSAQRGV